MIWVGVVIVLITFAAILKNFEARLVLLASGALMCIIAAIGGVEGTFVGAFGEFTAMLCSASLVPTICVCMGFSVVMDYTKCSTSLINILTAPLKKVRVALVPGAVLITWLINIVVVSASGCGATVGALLIPMLMSFGVHPATAAAAVLIGTWGNALSPGNAFAVQIADLAGTDTMSVIHSFLVPSIIVLVVSIALLTIIDIALSRRNTEKIAVTATEAADSSYRNPIKAIIPMLPIILLLLGNWGVIPNYDVAIWMTLCAFVGMALDYKHVTEGAKQFFSGMGAGYRDIITLMAAAAVFTYGMSAIGLTNALVELMKNSTSIAKLGASFGPFVIAALSGSGNAATIAFNNSITPFAADFGFTIENMGSMAMLAACLGRDASPVAGVTIIVAKMAGVNPMDVIKRAFVPMLVGLVLFMFILL
ncbi:MAG: C4-dicarboxylate transporter DcuC [Clostridia bacterium]|nr:C4-dicarboxylate transporter DcuC [Clostridia bacterium]